MNGAPVGQEPTLPLLPMQARSLVNVGWDLEIRYFTWASISDPRVEPEKLHQCLNAVVAQVPALRATFVEGVSWRQRIVPYRDDGSLVQMVHHDLEDGPDAPAEIMARHRQLIDNSNGHNIALIVLQRAGKREDILLLTNHYFLDYYSSSWLTAEAFRRYRLEPERRMPPTDLAKLCEWQTERSRDEAALHGLLHELRERQGSRTLPRMLEPLLTKTTEAPGKLNAVELDLGEEAAAQFRSLAKEMRLPDITLGLLLLGRAEAMDGGAGVLHVAMKESGRALTPINTLGLPCFLANTAEFALAICPDMAFDDYVAEVTAALSRVKLPGISVCNLELPDIHDISEQFITDAAARPRPRVLVNCVNLHAFSDRPRADGQHGLYCDKGYNKREDLELRFIITRSSLRLNVSTRRAMVIDPAATVLAERIVDQLSILQTAVA